MYYNEDDKNRILDATNNKLVEVISDFIPLSKKLNLNKYVGKCPCCGKTDALEVNPVKGLYSCFKCKQVSGNNAISFLMKEQNMTFPNALEYLQQKFSVYIPTPEAKPIKPVVKKSAKKKEYYRDVMLQQSGLTLEDVKASCFSTTKNSTNTTSFVFQHGTHNNSFDVVDGDDVIIEYFDLEGNPVKYEVKKDKKPTGKFKTFFRVRYQFPHEHPDKEGKPVKYRSPWGSGNFLYIPEAIRKLCRLSAKERAALKIDRLFIQEGEKKAEKACKHEIWSVGISGINNLAQDKHLPEDLIKIIQLLGIKEVILLYDADFNDLSGDLKITDNVEKRPSNFYYAARNFKEYMRTLKNRDIYIETYIGHVNANELKDKGIDDLLTNTLHGKEEDLKRDIDTLINEKDLTGEFLTLHKITAISDNKLQEIWSLNNPSEFAKVHYEVLKHFPEFKIGKHLWRFNESGQIESSQPIENDEQYWEEILTERNGQTKKTYEFRYGRSYTFLQNRGFGRHLLMDGKSFQFIHLNHPFVRTVETFEIKDYIMEFTKVVANEDVLEMLYKGGVQYLGPDKLSNLSFFQTKFEDPSREYQRIYFKDNFWEIKADSIREMDYTNISYSIWQDQKQNHPAKLLKPLVRVSKTDDKFDFHLSDDGKRCQFLTFLINTSNFTWKKEKQIADKIPNVTITDDEIYENKVHLISKLAAIGYMLMSSKDRSVSRAVIGMDGKQSDVGQSNGRSGKSILGEMFKKVMPTISINGKKADLETDTFIWDEMTEKTKSVFIDDVRVNFMLEFLFANITGDWSVNYKGGRRITIPFHLSPKIYITTNHALNGTGSSFMDRQWLIAFSDWYNDKHKPVDDFGNLFFDEWDFDQWNLLWNMLGACVQVYLKYGVVQAPQERLQARKLRQEMGENFITWADEYFSNEKKLGVKLHKKNVHEEFIKYSNSNTKFESITLFKKKLQLYCKWKGYEFNPHLYDPITKLPNRYDKDGNPIDSDKSGGIEYVTIAKPGQVTIATNPEQPGEVVPPNDEKPF